MNNALTNNQFLLNQIVKQGFQENQQFDKEDMYFEFFAAQQVLKPYDLSDEEIETGLVGCSLDGGCDGIYFFANGDLVCEDNNIAEKYKKDIKLDFIIIQAKNSPSFSEDTILKWRAVCNNLLNLNNNIESFIGRYDEKILRSLLLFRDTYFKLARRNPRLNIEFYYVSKGKSVHQNVNNQSLDLTSEIKNMFPNPSFTTCTYFIGADRLMELIETKSNNEYYIKAEEVITVTSQQNYIVLVNLVEYYKFITNDTSELIKHIFESNVRDYQGHTSVNKEIHDTLETVTDEDFWWLNNGVTIIAAKASAVAGKEINISFPEIVNGLQTSSEIYKYFSANQDRLKTEKRTLLVRIIVPKSDASRDKIILATNSQTSIPKSSLRATDNIHRQIEIYFKPKKLFYDRRKNYYKNLGITVNQIISVSFLAQCLMSTILQKPNDARARPSTLLTDNNAYNKLYNENQDLNVFYNVAYIGRKTENVLKGSSEYTPAQKTDILFYVTYAVFCKKIGQTNLNSREISKLDAQTISDEDILFCANIVFNQYLELGGTDRVAKGVDLISRLKEIILL